MYIPRSLLIHSTSVFRVFKSYFLLLVIYWFFCLVDLLFWCCVFCCWVIFTLKTIYWSKDDAIQHYLFHVLVVDDDSLLLWNSLWGLLFIIILEWMNINKMRDIIETVVKFSSSHSSLSTCTTGERNHPVPGSRESYNTPFLRLHPSSR